LADDNITGDQPFNGSIQEAFDTAEACMQLFMEGDVDSVIEFLPDEVIDSALERNRSKLGEV